MQGGVDGLPLPSPGHPPQQQQPWQPPGNPQLQGAEDADGLWQGVGLDGAYQDKIASGVALGNGLPLSPVLEATSPHGAAEVGGGVPQRAAQQVGRLPRGAPTNQISRHALAAAAAAAAQPSPGNVASMPVAASAAALCSSRATRRRRRRRPPRRRRRSKWRNSGRWRRRCRRRKRRRTRTRRRTSGSTWARRAAAAAAAAAARRRGSRSVRNGRVTKTSSSSGASGRFGCKWRQIASQVTRCHCQHLLHLLLHLHLTFSTSPLSCSSPAAPTTLCATGGTV